MIWGIILTILIVWSIIGAIFTISDLSLKIDNPTLFTFMAGPFMWSISLFFWYIITKENRNNKKYWDNTKNGEK